jgi:hypothetical protein
MFPLGGCLLVILLFSGKLTRRRIFAAALAGCIFVCVCLPFVAALSKQKGFTFGESGRLAYSSMVSPGSPQLHWQGEPLGGGIPRHTTRKLLDSPPVFEFSGPVGGTYPPWYDPSYWNEGQIGSFRLRAQMRVLVQSGLAYMKMLSGQLGFLAVVIFFLMIGGAPTRRAIASHWPLIVMACLALGAYSLVLVRPRYVGGSFVILIVAVLYGIRLPKRECSNLVLKYVTAAVMCTMLFAVAGHLVQTAYSSFTVGRGPMQKEEMEAAAGLRAIGLKAGDPVAVIGTGETEFWARLGRFKIVAEVFAPDPGSRGFWAASPQQRNLALKSLGGTGAKVVVAWNPPKNYLGAGWSQISSTNYYAYSLSK